MDFPKADAASFFVVSVHFLHQSPSCSVWPWPWLGDWLFSDRLVAAHLSFCETFCASGEKVKQYNQYNIAYVFIQKTYSHGYIHSDHLHRDQIHIRVGWSTWWVWSNYCILLIYASTTFTNPISFSHERDMAAGLSNPNPVVYQPSASSGEQCDPLVTEIFGKSRNFYECRSHRDFNVFNKLVQI